ncbi:MAG: hypothetical protein J6D47_16500 [Peptostreptococcaceae bacterium]|nr:hypothetical protein [Peptostreptococcaceae bacterium]
MNISNTQRIEKCLKITETDIINGGEVLVLIAYAVRENDDMWSYPSPQIFNEELYNKNKEAYNLSVKQFRDECEV